MEFLKLNIQLFAISADATNDNLKSTAGNKGTLYVKFTEANLTEQNIKDNTSTITAYCKFTQNTGSWAQFAKPYLRLYWYDDNEFKSGVELINMNVTALSRYDFEELELTFTVNHKSDGSLKGYAKAKWEYDGTGTLPCQTGYATTAEKTLATVPRASEIVSTDAYIETPPTITITKKSSGFTTTVNYSFGSLTGTIVEKTAEDKITNWVVPKSFYAQIPNDPFAYCTLTAITYNGTTKVGEKTCTFKVTADPDRTRPKVSFTAVDVNAKTVALTSSNASTSDVVITGQSNVKCTISSITKEENATIKSVKINGIELGSAREYTFNGAITNEFQVVVTDSRGYSNVETKKTLGKINYNPVTIKPTVVRNTATDGKVNIFVEGNYSDVKFPMENNYLLLEYKWKEKGAADSTYTSGTITATINDDGTYDGELKGLTNFDYRKMYIFQVTAKDRLTSAPNKLTEILVKKGEPIVWWNENGVYANGILKGKMQNTESGCVGTSVALSSYWYKIWDAYITHRQYNDFSCTLQINNRYGGQWGTFGFGIRQNGANGSGAYNLDATVGNISGNIPWQDVRLYYDNTTGYCALYMYQYGQYGCIPYKVVGKNDRTSEETANIPGTFYSGNYTEPQTLPSSSYSTMVDITLAKVYPVGSIFMSVTDGRNPVEILGFGTWSQIQGLALVGAGTYTDSNSYSYTFTAGTVSGAYTHTHVMTNHIHARGTLTAALAIDASYIYSRWDTTANKNGTKTASWTRNARKPISGTNSANTASMTEGTPVIGNTGAMLTTAGASSTIYTGSGSSVQPSFPVYMWRRTA